MKIKIAHLYYDLMNLYGENANIRALKKAFERQNVEVEIFFLTIGDKINFKDFDIIYIGSGTEKYEILALNDLIKYKKEIKESIENNKYFFITGNAIELFGEYIEDLNGKKIDCLKAFDYYTKAIDIEYYTEDVKFRITGEVLGESNLIDKNIVGFQNRSGTLYNVKSPFIKIIKGCGNTIKDSNEGFIYKNFYGTYTLGPLFIRNPYLTNHFVKNILLEKSNDFKYIEYNNTLEITAYNEYIKNFVNKKEIS